MRTRLAAAVTAAALAIPVMAGAAGASPSKARPDHACPASPGILHKCKMPKK